MRRRKRLLWTLFPTYLLITVISLGAAVWFTTRTQGGFLYNLFASDLEARARLIEGQVSTYLEREDYERIDRLAKEIGQKAATRVTVILPSGKVVGDTHEEPSRMDNHALRTEVHRAIRGHVGVATRYSRTLGREMMYVGIPVHIGGSLAGVLRTSIPYTAVNESIGRVTTKVSLGGFFIAVLAACLSLWVSRRITRPLEDMKKGAVRFTSGDLNHRLQMPASEELAALSTALNEMGAQLDARIKEVQLQRNRLEVVLSSMVEGVLAVDADERVLRLNEAAARMLGCVQSEAAGRTIQEVTRNTKLQHFVAETLGSEVLVERDLGLYSGGDLVVRAHGTALLDESGQRMGALVVLNDITRLRQLENVRRDFVANVSHEIKTPLTAIKGFVETLMDGADQDPDDRRRFLEIISRHVERLEALVEDLLNLSRIEGEKGIDAVGMKSEPLSGILQAAAGLVSERLGEHSDRILVSCDPEIKAPMAPLLLEQAVVNLIENAVKYSGPETRVRVEASRSETHAIVSVTDEGAGIPEEHLPRIFERFYRVDKSRSRKLGGTGLGLAIVKHVVHVHGGRVEVKSTPGEGSTFSIFLPLEPGAKETA